MACGCAVVASSTAPVLEAITHELNGLLVDFFSPSDLAEAVAEVLSNRTLSENLGRSARETVVKKYSLDSCLPKQLYLLDLVATRSIG
jgi:glycosyltransferase involved in cell wall biosynthesis